MRTLLLGADVVADVPGLLNGYFVTVCVVLLVLKEAIL